MKQLRLIILSFMVFSCSQPSNLSEGERKIIADDITITLNNYCGEVCKTGLTAEFKYLDSSQDFYWLPPGYIRAITYDSVKTLLLQNAARYKTVNNRYEALRIAPLSKELAGYTGRIHSSITDTMGSTEHFVLEEIGIMIKRKDGWKLLNGQTYLLPLR